MCADLVAPFQEGCGGFGEGAQVVYQNAAWIECTSYNKRLDISRLFSLEHQRLREGLLDVSGIIRDKDRVDSQNLFLSFLPPPTPQDRSPHLEAIALRREGQSSGGVWKALPDMMMEAGVIEAFK